MNKKIILTLAIFLSISICGGVCNKIVNADTLIKDNNANYIAATQTKKTPAQAQKSTKAPASNSSQYNKAIPTTSLNIVNNPEKYLNKTVKMQATFDKFSTLGLDYQKAMRSSNDYIGILIQRDDVINHNIPLSEMKLFLSKELAEKNIDLDTGDKIEITAKEFSTALGDPWLDIESLTVIKKAKTSQEEKK